jgi:hypothetical protein
MVEVKHNERLRAMTLLSHQAEQVYYLSYPCENMSACWVVHKVNPHERLYTPSDVGYHGTRMLDGEVYQKEELPSSFIFETSP